MKEETKQNILNSLVSGKSLTTVLSAKAKEFMFESVQNELVTKYEMMDGRFTSVIKHLLECKGGNQWIWHLRMTFGLFLHAWDSHSLIKIVTLGYHIVTMKN